MKTLLLMRHAKTEPFSGSGDHARELVERGHDQCRAAAGQLANLGLTPESTHLLCSTAARTRQTAALLGLDAEVDYLDALYNCGTDEWLSAIAEVDESVSSLVCVGHAPAMGWLAAELAQPADPLAAQSISEWFPTATWVHFELDQTWAELASAPFGVRFVGVHRPLKD